MFKIKGIFSTATIFSDHIDPSSEGQIKALCNQPFVEGCTIRMMPDVHAGKGCVIGTTIAMPVCDTICPSLVGVDIGCGMLTVQLKDKRIDFPRLDKLIHAEIPSGFNTRRNQHRFAEDWIHEGHADPSRSALNIGTLGGGNHFIEIDTDDEDNLYLIIHTGSRNYGAEIARYYQNLAGESCHDAPFELAYLQGDMASEYLSAMERCMRYAELNRAAIADTIIKGMKLKVEDEFTTMHNYIDGSIIRKGAVSAAAGERLLIPLNMRDGALICLGKGNADWNCSAPHGAGRLYSRSEAKGAFTLTRFKAEMKGVFTSCVSRGTIDESPMAYKAAEDIISQIGDTVDIVKRLRPLYNFKAGGE